MLPHLVIAAILLGSALSIVNQRDYWPFSHYPMFADVQGPDLSILEVVGISSENHEISLAPSRRTSVVGGKRFQDALALLVERQRTEELHDYLVSLARRYQRTAAALPLQSVRLYRARWRATPVQSPPVQRIERTLVTEIGLTGE